jgi:hypothetical protein
MNRLSLCILITIMTLATVGCSHNYYNIPRETYEKKVRVIGVAPIFLDADSDIRHPEKDTLVALVNDFNRKNESELVAGVKTTGSYFSVTFLPDDPSKLFSEIMFRREKRDDAGIMYNKYFYKGPEIRNLIARNSVDAVLLVVVSGLNTREDIYSSNLLSKLESDYNDLAVSGQIIDAEGNILWEFPNFRQRRLSYPKFIALQYPDFDEARANETDKVEVKFKTIPGINRYLGKTSPPQYRINAPVSDAYGSIFNEMISTLRRPTTFFSSDKKEKGAPSTVNQEPAASAGQAPVSSQAPPATQSPASTGSAKSPPGAVQPTASQASKPVPVNITAPAGSPPAEQVVAPTIAPAN